LPTDTQNSFDYDLDRITWPEMYFFIAKTGRMTSLWLLTQRK